MIAQAPAHPAGKCTIATSNSETDSVKSISCGTLGVCHDPGRILQIGQHDARVSLPVSRALACTCTIGSLLTYATRTPGRGLAGNLVHIAGRQNPGHDIDDLPDIDLTHQVADDSLQKCPVIRAKSRPSGTAASTAAAASRSAM